MYKKWTYNNFQFSSLFPFLLKLYHQTLHRRHRRHLHQRPVLPIEHNMQLMHLVLSLQFCGYIIKVGIIVDSI